MTSRPLTALAVSALVSGALLGVATPASAVDACYPPRANCVAQGGVEVTLTYDSSTNTVTITVTGLRPGSTVTVTVVLPSGATGTSFHGGALTVAPATYRGGAGVAPAALMATSRSVAGTANAQGVAHLRMSLASFGHLSAAQIAALAFSVSGTAVNGSRVSFDTGVSTQAGAGAQAGAGSDSSAANGSGNGAASGSDSGTGGTASGSSLPRTGADLVPIGVVGATLVLGGAGVVLLGRRRRRAGADALGA